MQVVVQHQKRLFREGLELLLSAERGMALRGTAETVDGLVDLCRQHRPDVALVEVHGVTDRYRLSRRLRREVPGLRIVGLAGPLTDPNLDRTHAETAGVRLVPGGAGFTAVMDAIRAVPGTPAAPATVVPMPLPVTAGLRTNGSADAPPLTARETAILLLVGGGWTSQVISDHLRISPKTVENHKQRIFAKLGVQNQAHAVAVAIREGLITPDRMMSLVAE